MDLALPRPDDLLARAPTRPPAVHAGKSRGEAEMRETAQAFEAFFLKQMAEHMTAGLSFDGPFGGGHAEGIWHSMMNDEYAKAITRSGGIGIADTVYRHMLQMQEV